MATDIVPDERPPRSTTWAADNRKADLGTFQEGLPVRLIATERSALSTCDPAEEIAAVVARNNEDAFDHLPVVESDQIVGLIELVPFIHAAEPSGLVQDGMTPLSEGNLIGADASILSFIRDADRQRCRLVVSRREISGLVSLSDLQKLPARAALFAMVTHLEMTMVDAIRRETDGEEQWLEQLSGPRKFDLLEEVEDAKSSDAFVEALLFTQFADKITVLKKSPFFKSSKSEFKSEMHQIQKLRNHLAHANNYANTRERAASVCETVRLMDGWIERLAAWPTVSD